MEGVLALLVAALLLPVSAAWAVPPPMSKELLEQDADTVVEVESVEISCTGVSPSGEARLANYVATAKPLRWHKGKQVEALRIAGAVPIDPLPPGGIPNPPLPRGWRGKVHLRSFEGGVYGLVWYNAAEEDLATSKPAPLPECGGASPTEPPRPRRCGGCTATLGGPALVALLLVVTRALRRRSA